MPRATDNVGRLIRLEKCYIETPNLTIYLKVLPELTDSKGATYTSEPIAGRTTPLVNYGHSEANTISSDLTFIVTTCQDIVDNFVYLTTIKSLVYPGPNTGAAPYTPPQVCKFVCGRLFGDNGVCVILKNYSIRYPTDVAWDVETYLPYKFTIACSWEVVYSCNNLPTNTMIRNSVTNNWLCPPRSVDA